MADDKNQPDGDGLYDGENDFIKKLQGSQALIPNEEHRLREKDGTVMPPELMQTQKEIEAANAITRDGNPRKREHKAHIVFDTEKKMRFCELLARYGVKYKCAKAVGVAPYTVSKHEQQDPDFKEAVELSMEIFRDIIEETVIDRAIHGWDEPVYSQKLGVMIGTIRKFDNKLLELLAKRHIPAFRDKQQIDHNVSGGVLVAPAEMPSSSDWAEKHTKKLPPQDNVES